MNLNDYELPNWNKPLIENKLQIESISVLVLKRYSIEIMETPSDGVKNLIAVNQDNDILWVADLPHGAYLSYGGIYFEDNVLEAWCGDIKCIVDVQTGKLISEKFVK